MPFSGSHLPIAISRELVQEAIRRCVIGLSGISHRTGDRRKQYEEIELYVSAGLVQIECAVDFRHEHLSKFVSRLLQDKVVRSHPGTVKDAVELATLV
ncbi:MAG: hypothetical protein ABI837_07760, partial [Acidobacteriota bacterium]